MRHVCLILLLLVPLCVHAAAQPSGTEYVDMPAAGWLGLPYRQQIKSVKTIAVMNGLEMCHKQILDVVNCMRAVGTSPGWEGSKAGNLFTRCSSGMGEGPASCAPKKEAIK